MKFTNNDLGQYDIIKKNIILTKQDVDMINKFILVKYHKYPQNTIIKHANVLDKVNKPSYKCSLHMMPQPNSGIHNPGCFWNSPPPKNKN